MLQQLSVIHFFSTKVDGININTKLGATEYYPDFVKKLRHYMDANRDKKYFITASPLCFYPDRFIEKAYEQHSDKFDYLFLDTGETTCNFNNLGGFNESITKWLSFPGPEMFFTVPADERAALNKTRYLKRNEVIETVQVRV